MGPNNKSANAACECSICELLWAQYAPQNSLSLHNDGPISVQMLNLLSWSDMKIN